MRNPGAYCRLSLFLMLAAFTSLQAMRIEGKVAQILDEEVGISYESELAPETGAPVHFGFDLGGEFVPVQGTWVVTRVTPDLVWAKAVGEAPAPGLNYLARIDASAPVARPSIGGIVEQNALEDKAATEDGDKRAGNPLFEGKVEIEAVESKPSARSRNSTLVRRHLEEADRYFRGDGVARDRKRAFSAYMQAASKGNALAMLQVAYGYEYGWSGETSAEKAVDWFQQAAQAGNAEAMSQLAYRYADGKVLPFDYGKSLELYKKAVTLGDLMAMTNLGEHYRRGLGVPVDSRRAYELIRRGAEGGRPYGQFALGRLYERGCGVKQDFDEALSWYSRALNSGSPEAEARLKEVRFRNQRSGPQSPYWKKVPPCEAP